MPDIIHPMIYESTTAVSSLTNRASERPSYTLEFHLNFYVRTSNILFKKKKKDEIPR